MNQVLLALIVLIGHQNKDWVYYWVEAYEWVEPRYGHQN